MVGIRGGDGFPRGRAGARVPPAALLAGNAVVLAAAYESLGRRFAAALGRAGAPDDLVPVVTPNGAGP